MVVLRCTLLSEFFCFWSGDLVRQKRSPSLLLSDLKIGYVYHHQFYVPVGSGCAINMFELTRKHKATCSRSGLEDVDNPVEFPVTNRPSALGAGRRGAGTKTPQMTEPPMVDLDKIMVDEYLGAAVMDAKTQPALSMFDDVRVIPDHSGCGCKP